MVQQVQTLSTENQINYMCQDIYKNIMITVILIIVINPLHAVYWLTWGSCVKTVAAEEISWLLAI
jgi:hypothetical protein